MFRLVGIGRHKIGIYLREFYVITIFYEINLKSTIVSQPDVEVGFLYLGYRWVSLIIKNFKGIVADFVFWYFVNQGTFYSDEFVNTSSAKWKAKNESENEYYV